MLVIHLGKNAFIPLQKKSKVNVEKHFYEITILRENFRFSISLFVCAAERKKRGAKQKCIYTTKQRKTHSGSLLSS